MFSLHEYAKQHQSHTVKADNSSIGNDRYISFSSSSCSAPTEEKSLPRTKAVKSRHQHEASILTESWILQAPAALLYPAMNYPEDAQLTLEIIKIPNRSKAVYEINRIEDNRVILMNDASELIRKLHRLNLLKNCPDIMG